MKEKWKQFHLRVKALFHYLVAIGFTVIFALFCSGRVGWFLMLMLVLTPILSVVYMLLTAPFLEVSTEQTGEILNKGETCRVSVKIRNRGLFPVPPVIVSVADSPSLTADMKQFYTEVLPFQTATENVVFTARMSGASEIGIEQIFVSDFFSFFKRSIAIPADQKKKWSVGIIPDIAEIPFEGDYIREISQCALGNDDSEETLEYSSAVFGGFPGYEHRAYQPGDPIKRINWKLSAGREELFVRLDEVKAGAGVTMILDPCMLGSERYGDMKIAGQYKDLSAIERKALLEQNTIEDALGHVRVLLSRELSVIFCVKLNGTWQQYAIHDEDRLTELTRQLANTSFSVEQGERIPDEIASHTVECNAILYCTPMLGQELATALQNCKREDVSLAIYVTITEEGVVL